jgi:colanic acid biosynthesis glycosyl transferase WcaI
VIDNWCDGDAIRPAAGENPLRRELGLDGKFTIGYSGNMGHGHEFGTLVEAMAALRDRPIHWLLIGDGPRRAELEQAIRARGITRVRFLPYRPREELAVSLTAADASLVTLEERMAGLIVPSKLYSILAAGQPVVYVGPDAGRVAAVLREQRIGWSIRNGDVAGLVRAVVSLDEDRAGRAAMGRRARELFDARFSREAALERHHRLLLRVVGEPC